VLLRWNSHARGRRRRTGDPRRPWRTRSRTTSASCFPTRDENFGASSATAVRIRPTRDSNLFVAVLGWREGEEFTSECRLPESDRSGHRDLEDVFAYLEDVELACLSNQLRILRVNDPVEGGWEDDRRSGVKTKHRRIVFELEFECDLGSIGPRLSVGQDRRWNALTLSRRNRPSANRGRCSSLRCRRQTSRR